MNYLISQEKLSNIFNIFLLRETRWMNLCIVGDEKEKILIVLCQYIGVMWLNEECLYSNVHNILFTTLWSIYFNHIGHISIEEHPSNIHHHGHAFFPQTSQSTLYSLHFPFPNPLQFLITYERYINVSLSSFLQSIYNALSRTNQMKEYKIILQSWNLKR